MLQPPVNGSGDPSWKRPEWTRTLLCHSTTFADNPSLPFVRTYYTTVLTLVTACIALFCTLDRFLPVTSVVQTSPHALCLCISLLSHLLVVAVHHEFDYTPLDVYCTKWNTDRTDRTRPPVPLHLTLLM
ncbi:uncharacterized protein LAESUDRAFT_3748 [Laetiporus sulphureus 93-53]|uniref:Uncharacterized protein n=1 Tax=Laetiporus sulphureus 93-53 TaxID=1314785 RepID=A0A165I368_9APHY|nr:uncharacterized protein LAESUDRAFT_3748 [Laetiporus sulphureus 93-53]KZT12533.1 hypothetical protein LAESUDRAFT_3748 [Laetiporus sulphureus 93-53]